MLRVLALTRYGRLGASSRLRTMQYLPMLESQGVRVVVQSLLDDSALHARYLTNRYTFATLLHAYWARLLALCTRHEFDVLWIEYEALPWWPVWVERVLLHGVPYVLEYDDAVFHRYDGHSSGVVRFLFGQRLDRLMAQARLVIAGNAYLARRALSAGARWIEELPTVVDLDHYPVSACSTVDNDPLKIVWIGSPATVHYLQLLAEPLRQLARSHRFIVRVIGGGSFELEGVPLESIPWAENTEVDAIRACDIGIMALPNEPWELGKCGYKLIQYMSCSLPVVASPVGMNAVIVKHGQNGYLASSPTEWVDGLGRLLTSAALRRTMGAVGRLLVEQHYCVQQTAPKLGQWLRRAADFKE